MTLNPNVKRLAILAGGGPAPGINSVVSAAAIRAALSGTEVIGIMDGFKWIMEGNIEHIMPLTIENVSRIHVRGGSHIGISRANPTKLEQHLENSVISLLRLNVDRLITIGGDDTAYSAYMLNERSKGRSGSSTSPRPSTTTSTCPWAATPSASRPRATWARASSAT